MARRRVNYVNRVSNLRTSLLSGALGLCIGSIGTLLLISSDQDEVEQRQEHRDNTLRHESLRYGAPTSGDTYIRTGYVVSYDFRC